MNSTVLRTLVAPFTGAWIEISSGPGTRCVIFVAPFTGAWIEISLLRVSDVQVLVAPFTGAWIEICSGKEEHMWDGGRSLHGSVD